jgi:hypothetical protein
MAADFQAKSYLLRLVATSAALSSLNSARIHDAITVGTTSAAGLTVARSHGPSNSG